MVYPLIYPGGDTFPLEGLYYLRYRFDRDEEERVVSVTGLTEDGPVSVSRKGRAPLSTGRGPQWIPRGVGARLPVQVHGHTKPPDPESAPLKYPKRSQYKYAESRYRVRNRAEYEADLQRRGDLAVWLSDAALRAWRAPPGGRPGGQHISALPRRPDRQSWRFWTIQPRDFRRFSNG